MLKKLFSDYTESIPAFACIICMPLAYSISDGILIGMICYVLLNMFCGMFKKITIPMYILAAIFTLKYIFIVGPDRALANDIVAMQQEVVLSSPDGKQRIAFDVNDDGEAVYTLQFGDEQIASNSRLGINTSVGDFTTGLTFVDCSYDHFSETWKPVWGQHAEIENSYNELNVTLENADKQQIIITFRLFNDGLALRYTLSGEGECDIYNERTEFRMADNYEVHWMAGSDDDAEFDYLHTTLDVFYFDRNNEGLHCTSYTRARKNLLSSLLNRRPCTVKQVSIPDNGFEPVEYKGCTVNVPTDCVEHLTWHYGPTFMTPNPNFNYKEEAKNIRYFTIEERKGVLKIFGKKG